jgi:hypothetical protein
MPEPPRRSSASRASSGSPDRRALLQAYQDVVRTAAEERRTKPGKAAPPKREFLRFMGLVAVVLLAILVLQPRFLFPRPAEESAAMKEASLRVRMYVEIDRIDRFRQANGRLPVTLLEAKGDTSGVAYQRQGDDFSLTGRNGKLTLTYLSTTPADSFLGRSYQVIGARSTR